MSNQIIPDIRRPVNPSRVRDLPARLFCIRCHAPVPLPEELSRLVGRTYHSIGGVFIIDANFPMSAYCSHCSADLQICAFCGCTDEVACPGGCSWVQEDVCSACAPNAHPLCNGSDEMGDKPI
jgi:hypothetical protein